MNKEERRAYQKQWQKDHPEKMAEYNRRFQEKRKAQRHTRGRDKRKKGFDPAEAKKIFEATAQLRKNIYTGGDIQRMDAIKLAKLDINKIKVV